MVEITYFVHGTSTDNEQLIATGWADGALSELGITQAMDLGIQVQHLQFDIVFCSDLKRAIDSANLAFSDKYKIIQDPRLREANYGDLNQHPISAFKRDFKWYIHNRFPNGESYKEVEERLCDYIKFLKTNYANNHVAIVSHKTPQLALDVLLNHKSWEQAIDEDWRIEKKWQPGWKYTIPD